MIEAALGISAETIMNLQYRYNMLSAKKDKPFMERLAAIRKIAAL